MSVLGVGLWVDEHGIRFSPELYFISGLGSAASPRSMRVFMPPGDVPANDLALRLRSLFERPR
jgi:hypothetical protein